jgi:hypothetical protein
VEVTCRVEAVVVAELVVVVAATGVVVAETT